jgi:hypothetical protein
MDIIDASKVTFIVAGSLSTRKHFDQWDAHKVVESIRRHFSSSPIIISSTDPGININLDSNSCLLRNKDPGELPSYSLNDKPGTRANNFNRQLINVQQALQHVKTPFVLKTRTDYVFVSDVVLQYYNRAIRSFPAATDPLKLFNQRILVTDLFTTSPRSGTLFHVSDCLMLGKTEDLRLLWARAPISLSEATYGERIRPREEFMLRSRLAAEQYLMEHLVRDKLNSSVFPDYYYESSSELRRHYIRFFNANFLMLRYEDVGVSSKFDVMPHYLRKRLWWPESHLFSLFIRSPIRYRAALGLLLVSATGIAKRHFSVWRLHPERGWWRHRINDFIWWSGCIGKKIEAVFKRHE